MPKIQDVFCVESRMNQSSEDEYEEVESPFASKSSNKSSSRDRLRTRKNVFNRPFATDSSHAPTYFEKTPSRKVLGDQDNIDLIERRKSSLRETNIDYINNEEAEEVEEMETRPARRSSSETKKKVKVKTHILAKVGWLTVGVLILRLVSMDRGVWDYFSTEAVIKEKRNELKSLQVENKELKTEISRIQLDRNYQKQLAKEHLGVIATDEFLILFAGELPDVQPEVVNSI
jgi:cell division protein FtsB